MNNDGAAETAIVNPSMPPEYALDKPQNACVESPVIRK